jgi:hypothetical protein
VSHDARSVELLQVKHCDFAGVYKGHSTSTYMQSAVYVHSCVICMYLYTSHALLCMFIYTLTRVCVCVRARVRIVCVCEHLCAYSVNTSVLT